MIPNNTIENEFSKHNIKLCSKIIHLKTGIINLEFNHVLNFRSKVYVNVKEQAIFMRQHIKYSRLPLN